MNRSELAFENAKIPEVIRDFLNTDRAPAFRKYQMDMVAGREHLKAVCQPGRTDNLSEVANCWYTWIVKFNCGK